MESDETLTNSCHGEEQSTERKRLIADLLGDKQVCSLLIQKLKESGHVEKDITPTSKSLTDNTSNIPSGPWSRFSLQYPFAALPFWRPVTPPPWATSTNNSLVPGQPGSSCMQGQAMQGDDNDKDVIDLLDDAETLELVQFDPSAQDESTWEAGETINAFLETHFLHPLPPEL